jgi:hypothetical protein
MNTCFKYAAIAAAALGIASCSSDEPTEVSNFPADNVIRVTTNITDVVKSRSASEYTGDNFALYISPTNVTNIYTYSNVWFTRKDSYQWLPDDGRELHWQSQSTAYTYSAYAPASEPGENDEISYNLSNWNYDLIFASGSGIASELAASGALNLTFNHVFSRFTVDITIGNSFYLSSEENPISRVTFTNNFGAGRFNVRSGEIGDTSEVEITASEGSHTAGTLTVDGKYITGGDYMAPGTQPVTVTITANDVDYAYTLGAYDFEAGKDYTLTVKLGESSANATAITVSDWGTTEESDISTH